MSFGKSTQTTTPQLTDEQKAQIAAQTEFFTGTIKPTYEQAVKGATELYNINAPGALAAAQNLAGTALGAQSVLGEAGESALRTGITGLQSLFTPDYERQQIMAALAQEITAEIDQEILYSLRSLAASEFTFNQATVSGTATFVGDEHAALAVLINQQANLVAQRTRRGAANWAVVSSNALTILQSATTSAFARTTEGTFEAPTNTKFVGTLNNSMRVYVDAYAPSNTVVLIGYKGSSETDAAAFYCPYIPLMSSGVVLDPTTFEPTVGFLTRYGYKELTNTASSLGNAADYVSTIGIDTTNLKFS